MTDEFLRTHRNFEANLLFLCMAPTTNKFRFPQDPIRLKTFRTTLFLAKLAHSLFSISESIQPLNPP